MHRSDDIRGMKGHEQESKVSRRGNTCVCAPFCQHPTCWTTPVTDARPPSPPHAQPTHTSNSPRSRGEQASVGRLDSPADSDYLRSAERTLSFADFIWRDSRLGSATCTLPYSHCFTYSILLAFIRSGRID